MKNFFLFLLFLAITSSLLGLATERDPNEGPPKKWKVKVSAPKKAKTPIKQDHEKQKQEQEQEIGSIESNRVKHTDTAEKEISNIPQEDAEAEIDLEITDELSEAEGQISDQDVDSTENTSEDMARLFALNPTPTPLPQLPPDSEAFFTEVNELNEYFHQLKQPLDPIPTVAPLEAPLEPPRTVFKALLIKGASVSNLDDPSQQITTNHDYFVQAAIDDYNNPAIILDRQGNPRYQVARHFLVDLEQDLNLKLSPLTNNPQQAWLRDELRRNDPSPSFIQRFLAGIGESALTKTAFPQMAQQALRHLLLEYQITYNWSFPLRVGLVTGINYERYQKFSWPSWSLGPLATYHFIWGRHQFELLALWQSLFYSQAKFEDPDLNQTFTGRGSGSLWQIGFNYLFILHGKVFPCGIFYQRGVYNFEQNKNYTRHDIENASHHLHAIGLRFGWQWD